MTHRIQPEGPAVDEFLSARITRYRTTVNTGNGRRPNDPVARRNPYMDSRTYEAAGRESGNSPDIDGLLMFSSLVAGMPAITAALEGHLAFALFGFSLFAPTAALFVASVIKNTRSARKYGHTGLAMEPQLGAAWADWYRAVDGVRALGDADEALEALLANDDRVRATVVALHEGTLIGAPAREAREWLYVTCAKAQQLRLMERERKEAAEALTRLEDLSLPAGAADALNAALDTSAVLTENTKRALGASASPSLDPATS